MLDDICDVTRSLKYNPSQDEEPSEMMSSLLFQQNTQQKPFLVKCYKCYGINRACCQECRGSKSISSNHPMAQLLNQVLSRKLSLIQQSWDDRCQYESKVCPIKEEENDHEHFECEQRILFKSHKQVSFNLPEDFNLKGGQNSSAMTKNAAPASSIPMLQKDKYCHQCHTPIQNCYSLCMTCQQNKVDYWICGQCSDQKSHNHPSHHILQMMVDADSKKCDFQNFLQFRDQQQQPNSEYNRQSCQYNLSIVQSYEPRQSFELAQLLKYRQSFEEADQFKNRQSFQPRQLFKQRESFIQKQCLNVRQSFQRKQFFQMRQSVEVVARTQARSFMRERQLSYGEASVADSINQDTSDLGEILMSHRLSEMKQKDYAECDNSRVKISYEDMWSSGEYPVRIPMEPTNFNTPFNDQTFSKSSSKRIVVANNIQQGKRDYVFENYRCDECGLQPIVNFRYHCLIRADFDLCQNCYIGCRNKYFQDDFQEIDGRKLRDRTKQNIIKHVGTKSVKPKLKLAKKYSHFVSSYKERTFSIENI